MMRQQRSGQRRQRGAAMMVALVLLTVMGLTSAAMMRSALNSDQVANNTRSQVLAGQYAELALRYCEKQLLTKSGAITLYDAVTSGSTERWQSFSYWYGGSRIALSVPLGTLVSTTSSYTLFTPPECIAEKRLLVNDGTVVVVVTARGFSPDYVADSNGRTVNGSVVWLQSILRLA